METHWETTAKDEFSAWFPHPHNNGWILICFRLPDRRVICFDEPSNTTFVPDPPLPAGEITLKDGSKYELQADGTVGMVKLLDTRDCRCLV